MQDLILQIAGVGGHNHLSAAAYSRNQIGKGLAKTGLRLHCQAGAGKTVAVLLKIKRVHIFSSIQQACDRFSHPQLAWPEHKTRHSAGK